MNERNDIREYINKLIARKKKVLAVRAFLLFGGTASFLAALAFFLLVWFRASMFEEIPEDDAIKLIAALFSLVWVSAAIVALFRSVFYRPDIVALSKCLDDKCGYKDQVSSAVDLMAVDRLFAEAARERAGRLVNDADLKKVYPMRIPRLAALLIPALIMFLLAPMFMERDLSAAEIGKNIAEIGKQLRRFADEQEKKELTKEEKEVLEKIKRLAEQLKQKKISKKEALEALSDLKKQLAKKQEELPIKGFNLRKAAEALEKCPDTAPVAREFKRCDVKKGALEMKNLASDIGNSTALLKNEEFENMSDAFKDAAQHMGPFSNAAKQVSDSAKYYERNKTAQNLDALSRALTEKSEALELSEMLSESLKAMDAMQENLGKIREANKAGETGSSFMKEGAG